jgi:hypothetical protein
VEEESWRCSHGSIMQKNHGGASNHVRCLRHLRDICDVGKEALGWPLGDFWRYLAGSWSLQGCLGGIREFLERQGGSWRQTQPGSHLGTMAVLEQKPNKIIVSSFYRKCKWAWAINPLFKYIGNNYPPPPLSPPSN